MKVKKLLVTALALCMLLSLVPVSAFAVDIEPIAANECKVIDYSAAVESAYSFIPEKDGTYVVYGYIRTDMNSWNVAFTVTGPDGVIADFQNHATIEAKAGEEYTVFAWWGPWEEDWQQVEIYLMEGVPAERIEIAFEAGDYSSVSRYLPEDAPEVIWQEHVLVYPENAIWEEITWNSSNENVAKIIHVQNSSMTYQPVAVGKTTISVSMGNLCDSYELELKEKDKLELDKEETIVATTMSGMFYQDYLFTAKEAGTYVFYGWDVTFDTYLDDQFDNYERFQVEMEAGQSIEISAGFWYTGDGSDRRTFVVQKAVDPQAIEIIQNDVVLWAGQEGSCIYLSIETDPRNGKVDKIVWTSSDENIAKVDNSGWVTPVAAGTCTVTATVGDLTDSIDITVKQLYKLELNKPETFSSDTDFVRAQFIMPENGTYVIHGEGLLFEARIYYGEKEAYTVGIDCVQVTGQKGVPVEVYIVPMEEMENATYSVLIEKSVDAKSFEIRSVRGDGADDFVGVGRAKTVYLKMNPANGDYFDLAWKSNDESVLVLEQISHGLCVIYGVKPGQASISATIGDQTVTKTFTVDYYQPFGDVAVNKYYYEPVLWAVDMGITSGYKDETFRPDKTCTRAEVVTFLWRAAGEPKPETTQNPFADVATDKYYYDSVLWALENEITSGYKDGTFQPSKTCSRAEVVTFLWRAAGSPKPTKTDNPFEDVASDKYYYDAVLWAVEMGITTGKTATTFQPSATCTRAQIVTFLFRFLVGE